MLFMKVLPGNIIPELDLVSSANQYLEMARDAAKEIMDEGGFSIYTTGDPASDYLALFHSGGLSGNPEIIFFSSLRKMR